MNIHEKVGGSGEPGEQKSATYHALQEKITAHPGVHLEVGESVKDGMGISAKLIGPSGTEVMFFEGSHTEDSTYPIPEDDIEIGIKLAENLEEGDTVKINSGTTGGIWNDGQRFVHTKDPERIKRALDELGAESSDSLYDDGKSSRRTIDFWLKGTRE